MKLHLGRVASKSSGTLDSPTYDAVGAEYYDDLRHPTCADFREASLILLRRIFHEDHPTGRIADIGCGRSQVAEVARGSLVLVDESSEMISLNGEDHESRVINIVEETFGDAEFDWIFAVLADPYNEVRAWENISKALKPNGRCVFITPSYSWATKYRTPSMGEVAGKARFDLRSGRSIFLPSTILSPARQRELVLSVGLQVVRVEHVLVRELSKVRSEKISSALDENDPILDVYWVRK